MALSSHNILIQCIVYLQLMGENPPLQVSFLTYKHFFLPVEQARSDEPIFMYYMNDGVYGSFANKLSEKLNAIPEVHKVNLLYILL